MTRLITISSAPAEIDVCNAEQLRIALLDAGNRGHAMVVVDMTRTRFCDSEGFNVLVGAHKRRGQTAAACGWSSPLIPRSCGSS